MSLKPSDAEWVVAVPPPLLSILLENEKFDGEASVRVIGQSAFSHVSVKNMQSIFVSKIRSIIRYVLFKRDFTFKSAIFKIRGGVADVCMCVFMHVRVCLLWWWCCFTLTLFVMWTGIGKATFQSCHKGKLVASGTWFGVADRGRAGEGGEEVGEEKVNSQSCAADCTASYDKCGMRLPSVLGWSP